MNAKETVMNEPITYAYGSKNKVFFQEKNFNETIENVSSFINVNIDQLIQSAEYAISVENFQQAKDFLVSAVADGRPDYRIYICHAHLGLKMDHGEILFDSLEKLQILEKRKPSETMTEDIKRLMSYRGVNGVTALHCAAYHERLDLVQFCVEHGADVNCIAGMNKVTPLTIMYVHVDSKAYTKLDGTPFIRDKEKVNEIRKYLIAHGATDSKSDYKKFNKKTVNKVAYCILAFLLGYLGIHKFYSGKKFLGVLYLVFFWTYIPLYISIIEGIIAICKKADAEGRIRV